MSSACFVCGEMHRHTPDGLQRRTGSRHWTPSRWWRRLRLHLLLALRLQAGPRPRDLSAWRRRPRQPASDVASAAALATAGSHGGRRPAGRWPATDQGRTPSAARRSPCRIASARGAAVVRAEQLTRTSASNWGRGCRGRTARSARSTAPTAARPRAGASRRRATAARRWTGPTAPRSGRCRRRPRHRPCAAAVPWHDMATKRVAGIRRVMLLRRHRRPRRRPARWFRQRQRHLTVQVVQVAREGRCYEVPRCSATAARPDASRAPGAGRPGALAAAVEVAQHHQPQGGSPTVA